MGESHQVRGFLKVCNSFLVFTCSAALFVEEPFQRQFIFPWVADQCRGFINFNARRRRFSKFGSWRRFSKFADSCVWRGDKIDNSWQQVCGFNRINRMWKSEDITSKITTFELKFLNIFFSRLLKCRNSSWKIATRENRISTFSSANRER